MPLIYITGPPAVGKSALQEELFRRGFDARDIDNSEYGGPYEIATNKKVIIPSHQLRTPDWFERHEWRVYPEVFEKLAASSCDELVVICGVASADQAILPFFDRVIYLQLDDATLRQRISGRTDNDYGKNAFEAEEILERKRALDERYDKRSVFRVDASGPVAEVVDRIVLILRG